MIQANPKAIIPRGLTRLIFNLTGDVLKIISLSAITALLVACGDDGDMAEDAEDTVENLVRAPQLFGQWRSPCGDSEFFDLSEQKLLRFQGNSVEQEQIFFGDDDCKERAAVIQYSGVFNIQNAQEDSGILQVRLQGASLTPLTTIGVRILNTVNFCGNSNYETEKEVDISQENSDDLTCPFVATLPQTYFGHFRLNDNKMLLSAENVVDFSSQRAQAQQQSPEVEYTKD